MGAEAMSVPAPTTVITVSRTTWAALCAALLLPWVVVLWLGVRQAAPPPLNSRPSEAAAAGPMPPARQQAPAAGGLTGPWGELELTRIMIEPPEDCIPVSEIKTDAIRWFFRGYTDAKLRALWQAAGLDPRQQESLTAPAHWETTGDSVVIHPDEALVKGLSRSARTRIYTALAVFPENGPQHTPFRVRADSASDWFAAIGLSPEVQALAQSLVYERNQMAYFSDEDLILPLLKTPREKVRFLKTLSRKSTLLAQLKVPPRADIDALARYWGRGRRNKDLLPLLDSLSRRPDGAKVDLAHLLPRFPRSLLYTFPLPSDRQDLAAHDCHWTALNFFKEQPDERFIDIEFVKQTLLQEYYPAAGEPDFGDIVVLMQPDGVVVHSCVYLAGGIVFTKNGASYSVPWMLGELDAVVNFYTVGPPLSVRLYRPKT
jgi:hypothetical protein